MDGLLHFTDLLLFVFVVLILFRSGTFLEIAQRLERLDSDLRGEWRSFCSTLLMTKAAAPGAEGEMRDIFPEEEARRSKIQARMLLAFLMGNLLYFISSPFLPSAAVLKAAGFPGVPVLVDMWFCVMAFGILNLVRTVKAGRN
jgi:hypothetical protein